MCYCEDRPCCGCPSLAQEASDREAFYCDQCGEYHEGPCAYECEDCGAWGSHDCPGYPDEPEDGFTDAEADADTLASAGWGMDEDYGYYGDE